MNPEEKAQLAVRDKRRFLFWLWGLHALALLLVGLAFFPAVFLLHGVWRIFGDAALGLRVLMFSLCLSLAYFLFGVTLITLCAAARALLGFRIRQGLYPMYSIEALRWMGYNSLILIANAAFLDVLRLSPFQTYFYRAMGAKVGRDVNVNTGGLADLSMLDIGDHVVIGGGVALICHAVERGFLRLEPTTIGARASIGLGSIVMPGCTIGEGAAIAPSSFLPKGTSVPARGVWGGNPARDLRAERRAAAETERAD